MVIPEFQNLITNKCVYCGDLQILNGVDRKNNNEGYTIQNSVSCCTIYNQAKHAFSYTAFIEWIERVVKFHQRKEQQ